MYLYNMIEEYRNERCWVEFVFLMAYVHLFILISSFHYFLFYWQFLITQSYPLSANDENPAGTTAIWKISVFLLTVGLQMNRFYPYEIAYRCALWALKMVKSSVRALRLRKGDGWYVMDGVYGNLDLLHVW